MTIQCLFLLPKFSDPFRNIYIYVYEIFVIGRSQEGVMAQITSGFFEELVPNNQSICHYHGAS